MTTALGALVLVTSLVPVFAVCMAALGARQPDRGRLRRSSGVRPRIRLIPASGIATQSGRLSSS